MNRAIALVTTTALLTAACAPPAAPARDARDLISAPHAAPATMVRPATYVAAGDAPTASPAAASPATATDAPASSDGKTSGSEPSDEAHGGDVTARTVGWFSLTLGLASATVAVGTSIMMLSDLSTRNSDCNAAKQCSTSGTNANNQISQLAGWNTATYVVAAAGIGIGAFLLLTNPKHSEHETALGVTPNGVLLRGTF
jgi:hypothetical protein